MLLHSILRISAHLRIICFSSFIYKAERPCVEAFHRFFTRFVYRFRSFFQRIFMPGFLLAGHDEMVPKSGVFIYYLTMTTFSRRLRSSVTAAAIHLVRAYLVGAFVPQSAARKEL